MPQENYSQRLEAATMVANVLAGKTADGAADLGLAIPFPKNLTARQSAAVLLDRIIQQSDLHLDVSAQTALTAKFLAHLTKTGCSPEQISAFPITTLADAIREAPAMLTARANISAMLRGHARRSQQAAAVLRKSLGDDVPPRTLITDLADGYQLVEATDPRHLQQDSAVLKHCVGTIHNSEALRQKGLSKDSPEAIHCLHYWMEMKQGNTRILTLTKDGQPLLVMEYDVKDHIVDQLRTLYDVTPKGDEPWFPALCGALHSIKDPFELTCIYELPEIPNGYILTGNGSQVRATADNLDKALVGSIIITADNAQILTHAAKARCLTLDITHTPQVHLDTLEGVTGSLQTTAMNLNLPNLRFGNVNAIAAQTVNLPLHQTGNVSAIAAQTLNLPMHQTGDVIASLARTLNLPQYQAGYVEAHAAQTVNLPQHQTGDVRASSAKTVNLPQHQTGDVDAGFAQTVNLPQHRTGDVYARFAQTVNLPQHQTGDVYARFAKTVTIQEAVRHLVKSRGRVIDPKCDEQSR